MKKLSVIKQLNLKNAGRFAVVSLLCFTSWAAAQSSLEELLSALETSPEALELRANLDASRAFLEQQRSPFAVSGSTSYNYRPDDLDAPPIAAGIDVSFDPLILGDSADDARQAALELDEAEINYLIALSQLQIETIFDALDIATAEQVLDLRNEATQLAATQLNAAASQLERGSGTPSAVRQAELELDAAKLAAQAAADALSQARGLLTSRVGSVIILDAPEVAIPEAEAAAIRLAQLQREQAALNLGRAQRNLYPTLSAGYTQQFSADAVASASINSNNLSPSIGFDYNPGDDAQTRVRIGLSASFSPADISAVEVAQRRLDALDLNLTSARQNAVLRRSTLERNLIQAQAQEALAQRVLASAQEAVNESVAPRRFGLDHAAGHVGNPASRH